MITASQFLKNWLSRKPQCVQDLAKKYPPMTSFRLHNGVHWVIGYWDEEGATAGLDVTPIDPSLDYEEAVAAMVAVCDCCLPKLDELLIADPRPKAIAGLE